MQRVFVKDVKSAQKPLRLFDEALDAEVGKIDSRVRVHEIGMAVRAESMSVTIYLIPHPPPIMPSLSSPQCGRDKLYQSVHAGVLERP